MQDKTKIFVYFVQAINIDSDEAKGREAVQGLSVEYCFYGDNGDMLKSQLMSDNVCGIRRGKGFLPLEEASTVRYVPGIYEGEFKMDVNKDGKPTLRLVSLDYVSKAAVVAEADEPAFVPAEKKDEKVQK